MILNTSEAARHLGYSTRTTLQRLLAAGLLDDYRRPGGGRAVLLDTAPEGLPTLRERVQGLTQIRYNSPLWRRGGAEEASELERVAQRCNSYLDCSAWGSPPWTADQWQTLRVVLEITDQETKVSLYNINVYG